jgi:predicted DNA-binding transcriptional regulator AlpA
MDQEADSEVEQTSGVNANESLLWDAKRVAKALSVGQRTLWRWIAAGTFPAPDLAIGAKIRRWRRETVLGWIRTNAESRP